VCVLFAPRTFLPSPPDKQHWQIPIFFIFLSWRCVLLLLLLLVCVCVCVCVWSTRAHGMHREWAAAAVRNCVHRLATRFTASNELMSLVERLCHRQAWLVRLHRGAALITGHGDILTYCPREIIIESSCAPPPSENGPNNCTDLLPKPFCLCVCWQVCSQ